MTDNMDDRARQLAVYIIDTGATVRAAAKHFGISKSTVHKDLCQRLPHCDPRLYRQVRKVLDLNRRERHIRGGMATRRKYKGEYKSEPQKGSLLLYKSSASCTGFS